MKSIKLDNNTYIQDNLSGCIQKPFDVNGLTLLLCTSGSAVLGIDFKDYVFVTGDIALVPDGMSLIPRQISSLFRDIQQIA